jgi:beta-lactamase class A
MKPIYKIILISVVFLLLGVFIGYGAEFYKEHSSLARKLDIIHPIRLNNSSYKLVSPLLLYVLPSADQDPNLISLKNKISDLINTEKQKGLAKASVFMFDLNQGRWMGVNENETYPPASMFKAVIMVAYLKGAEQISGLMDNKFIYTKEIDEKIKKIPFYDQTDLAVGAGYTVNELINKMIIDSDNGAEEVLLNHLNKDFLSGFFNILDIKDIAPDGSFYISPRQYSLFFRIIYNATYLSVDSSEKALDTLSKTTFGDGLSAGVPVATIVAHKYGIYNYSKDDKITSTDLHDCGIVYYKIAPYFLCVMTNGRNYKELASVIKNISSLVYQNHEGN